METWIAGFVSVIAMSYLFEISMVHVDWPQAVVSWTVPNIPAGSMLVVMSILGAVIMPHNLFQGYSTASVIWDGCSLS